MIKTFWLILGYTCNNRCPHCYAAPMGFSSKWMNPVFAREVMAVLKEGGAKRCLLIGGEPTLCPNLAEFISLGSKMGLKMTVISNGRRLKDKHFTQRLFEAGLEKAVVSLLGASEDVHNSLTGCRSFDDTTEGIKVCAEIGEVNALTTICRGNSHQIPQVIEYAYQLGIKKAVLNCAIPTVSENGVWGEDSLSPVELAGLIDEVFWTLRDKRTPFYLNATFPICLLRQETLTGLLELGWMSVGCQMYRGEGVAFDPEGNVLPCTHFSEMPLIENTMGNNGCFKLKEDFWRIWDDPDSVAGDFRSSLWRYPAKRCFECKYWGGCIGGCPLLWAHFDPIAFIDRKVE